jgi:hypothetical protein
MQWFGISHAYLYLNAIMQQSIPFNETSIQIRLRGWMKHHQQAIFRARRDQCGSELQA